MHIVCDYLPADVFQIPEKLLDAEEIQRVFWEKAEQIEKEPVKEITGAEMMYTTVPAQSRTAGILLAPVWYLSYRQSVDELEGWAMFSAVDGTLLDQSHIW